MRSLKRGLLLFTFMVLLIAALALVYAGGAHAAGFNIAAPHKATCDAPGGTTTGMYAKIYYRTKGETGWTDAKSVNAGQIWTTPYDLLQIFNQTGNYELTATLVDAGGNESDFYKGGTGTGGSVPFALTVLPAPTGFGLK